MIWERAIARPVSTTVVFVALAIFGAWGYLQMPVRENPDVEFPIVTVTVVLPGAEPAVVETEIIEPLEAELNTIEGIDELRSTARDEVASITIQFELSRPLDVAVQDVRDAVDRAARTLPTDIQPPVVQRLDPDAQAVLWITLTGDARWDAIRISEYARNTLKDRLENLRGVGRVQVGGERAYAARVRLHPDRLAAHQLTVQEVVAAIRQNNVDVPSGRVESTEREFVVKTNGRFSEAGPMNALVVAQREGAVVRLGDVGEVVDGAANERQLARFNGQETVGLGIVKQSDANTLAVAEAVRARMAELAADLPPGLTWRIATDDSIYVRESVDDLLSTITIAALLVVLVVLLFLKTVAGTLVVALTIPTSLLIGTAVIAALGFSINGLTLLAFILAIGIVVDDAIVVLESCYRHMEEGAEPFPAARVGTTEVAFAAIANTLALAAVFVPVAFTRGLIGRFFFEFGLTVAITVCASTLTALTLTPMLTARVLRVKARQAFVFRWTERALRRAERTYGWLLAHALAHRLSTVLLGVAALVVGLVFLAGLEREFAPAVDRSSFIVTFETPEGSTLAVTDAFAREIEAVLADTPEVSHQFLAIGLSAGGPGAVNRGLAFVRLHPAETRERHQEAVMEDVRQRLARLPGGQAFVTEGGSMGGSAPLQVILLGADLALLEERQDALMAWMRQQPEFVGVRSDLTLNKPQVSVQIDRDRASQLGLDVAGVSETLRLLLGNIDVSDIERDGERYDVITEVAWAGRMVPDDLRRVHVRAADGSLVSLDAVARLEETVGPSEIHHVGRQRAATVSASTPPGVPLGRALARLEGALGELLPPDMDWRTGGQAEDFEESFSALALALVFSVVFIYLILAAQFESFLHPFTILLSLPLATVGAFGALWVLGLSLDVYAFIGLIMLLGMATKNAILLVDYANVLVARGSTAREAAFQAARVRFRPVLMTTVSTVLGMLPIALGFGAGGEARMALGVSAAAGLLATTFLTLLVIPVVYSLFDGARQGLARRLRRAEEPAT